MNKYVQAFCEVSSEKSMIEEVYNDVLRLYDILHDNTIHRFLANPFWSTNDKLSILQENLGSYTQITINFLKACLENKSMDLKNIFKLVRNNLEVMQNMLRIKVEVAVEFEGDNYSILKSELEKYYAKTVIIETIIKPSILGGIVIYTEGSIKMDFSFAYKLNKMVQISKDVISCI